MRREDMDRVGRVADARALEGGLELVDARGDGRVVRDVRPVAEIGDGRVQSRVAAARDEAHRKAVAARLPG